MSTDPSSSTSLSVKDPAPTPEEFGPGDVEQDRPTTCQNCQTLLQGSYCHECGQQHRGGAITFRDLGRNLADSLFDVERGFLYTLQRVLLNPGDVAKRYVSGERKTFTNPLTMFLLAATAVFFVVGFFQAEFVGVMVEATKLSVPDAEFEEGGSMEKVFGFTSREEYGETTFYFVQRVYSYLGIFYCLLIAIALRIFFSQHTIAENVVFQLYTFTQINLFGILSCVLALGVLESPTLYFGASFVVMFVFQALAGRNYWGRSAREMFLTVFGFMIGYAGTFVAMFIVGGLIGIAYALLL